MTSDHFEAVTEARFGKVIWFIFSKNVGMITKLFYFVSSFISKMNQLVTNDTF